MQENLAACQAGKPYIMPGEEEQEEAPGQY